MVNDLTHATSILQDKYGVSSASGGRTLEGFVAQSIKHMERQVGANQISVGDFHRKKAELLVSASTGLDNCSTCTQGEKL